MRDAMAPKAPPEALTDQRLGTSSRIDPLEPLRTELPDLTGVSITADPDTHTAISALRPLPPDDFY